MLEEVGHGCSRCRIHRPDRGELDTAGISWRRNVVIQRKLAEPRLVEDELSRRLADSYAAAKAMHDACPDSDLPDPCARRRAFLNVAVEAVDEFASGSNEPEQNG